MQGLNDKEQSDAAEELGEEKRDAKKKEKEGMADKAAKKVLEKTPYLGVAMKAGKMVGVDVYGILKKLILYVVVPLWIFIFAIIIFGGYFLTMNLLDQLKFWWILK